MIDVEKFEKEISNFYNAPYAVATDCCTHALELCLRYEGYNNIILPTHTYISVPFTLKKLNLTWKFEYIKNGKIFTTLEIRTL